MHTDAHLDDDGLVTRSEFRARRLQINKRMDRARWQLLFLFVGGVILSLAFSITLRVQANRIEYGRYDSCVARALEISLYNETIIESGDRIPAFPVPRCGVDPRTD